MKPITRYEADDGSVWKTEDEAIFRDTLSKKVKDAMAPLGSRPDLPHCEFSNGGGYFHHHPSEVSEVKRSLLALVREYGWEWEGLKNATCPPEDVSPDWFARILDGERQGPLNRAYCRLMCLDADGREWGQPYYAMHPDEGTQLCLGKSYKWKKEQP